MLHWRNRTNDDLADPATKEALRYSHALLEGFQSLATYPVTARTAEKVCSRIKGVDMQVRRVPVNGALGSQKNYRA